MAYLDNDKENQQQAPSRSAAGTSGGGFQAQGQQSPQSGQWTNIGAYLNANPGYGQQAAQGIADEAKGAYSGIMSPITSQTESLRTQLSQAAPTPSKMSIATAASGPQAEMAASDFKNRYSELTTEPGLTGYYQQKGLSRGNSALEGFLTSQDGGSYLGEASGLGRDALANYGAAAKDNLSAVADYNFQANARNQSQDSYASNYERAAAQGRQARLAALRNYGR